MTGFYALVHHSGLEWRTENKRSSVSHDVVQWNGPIPIPSDPSTAVCFEVYASFELQPTLGTGEQLRELTITVEELLDCSAKDVPFTFPPIDGDVVSPCSSILVTTKHWKSESQDSSALKVLAPHGSTTESLDKLEDATNQGHRALSRYRKHGEKRDLEHSFEQFESALSFCPLDHPCIAAAQSNLAMAKFILCQLEGTNASFDVPLDMYRNALAARPVNHLDRPSTLFQLAVVHFARFGKERDEIERARAEALLHEATELSTTDSHENSAATFVLQLHARRRADAIRTDGQSSAEQDSAARSVVRDPSMSGDQLLDRFERLGDLTDLQQAIAILEGLVKSVSIDDYRYTAALGSLGVALRYRFNRVGELDDLEDAISRQRAAVTLTPHGHPHRPSHLSNLGSSFRVRFERVGELSDLKDAISALRDAVELTPHGHPARPARLGDLGNLFLIRFQRVGGLSDLEDAVSRHRDAVELTPRGHPYKPGHLTNLGNSFLARFRRLGELSDLEDAISTFRDAVNLTPHGHPHKPGHLSNLGSSFRARFERVGELSDLEDAILALRDAVELTPRYHPEKPARLGNLGNSFRARFDRIGELSDLEDAILRQRDALELIPHGHPHKPFHLSNLGSSFLTRFQRVGELRDLEDAISRQRDSLELTPHNHPDKPRRLGDLGNSFLARFRRFGELSDLEDAISRQRDAVELTPHGHPDKPGHLSNLGSSFRARFERVGELSDLEDAISRQRDALELTPHGHPEKPARLGNLGNSLRAHFDRLGKLSDLEEAISRQRDALELTSRDHPDKPGHLNNLANSFLTRFERVGELSDLEDAILALRDAVELTTHDHPHKPRRLGDLGNSFLVRFQHVGELSDLENATLALRDAVELTPHDHPDKPGLLDNLGTSVFTRSQRVGELSDLEDAISRQRDAVELTPHGHLQKPGHLNNLGNYFLARFERLGELSDLEDAISRHRDAVELTPHGHPHKPRHLGDLGNSFLSRFRRFGELSDLESAISRQRDAVELTPRGHPEKPRRLGDLSISFFFRFDHVGELSDLEDAISRQRDALELTRHGHPDKPGLLNNLGTFSFARFERIGELSDLEDAISRQRDAVELTPHGHPHKPLRLSNFGNSFRARFDRLGVPSDVEQAIFLYSHAATAPTGPISVRFGASHKWISCARHIHHHSLFNACSVAISLLPQLAWIGLSLTGRYRELTRGADVVREAAAAALNLGFPETAVEWLEQGRSIVWSELSRLRNSYEELSFAHPDHARRLRELSAALEDASNAREKSLSALLEPAQSSAHDRAMRSLKAEADNHRALAIKRDKLLHEIRGFPDFERFLLHKEFSQLRASAHSGPVVILNAAEIRCDALIVLPDIDHAIHVPLPNFTFERSTFLQNMVHKLRGHGCDIHPDERKGKLVASSHELHTWNFETQGGDSWEFLLSNLWKGIVRPVLDTLAFKTPAGDPSRIFWCPTGPFMFLPVHGAGLYDIQHAQPGHKVSDFVVSSYAPTLSILTLSPHSSTPPSSHLRLLTVRQPPSDGLSHLPGVATELTHIREVIADSPSAHITLVESSDGTVEEVLELMKEADWVHFACHGVQDAAHPTNSGLCLADQRRLKLGDIIAVSRPHGGLAFLSACHTATGFERLSDEAIHIVAGMLFAGYGAVIGTMWKISDTIAPDVARDVYGQLFRKGTRPNCREAARALHDAIGRVRDSNASFGEWLPFIHAGL
ncbi:TPR-like protein [Boletus coccyginus]|nr:TPR-like protein [Boletus coccyginus]